MSGKKSKVGLLGGLLILAVTAVFLQSPVYSQISPGDVVQNDDLSNADLSGQDLSGVVFINVTLRGADLTDANLSETVFSMGTDLSEAVLDGVIGLSANLRGANLNFASLSNVDFSGADLRDATLTNSLIASANLSGANLCGADLTNANIAPSSVFAGAIHCTTTLLPPSFDPFAAGMVVDLSVIGEGDSPSGDLAFDREDLDFVLAQIKFAERHSAGEELSDILPNLSAPLGLRTVDGAFNNLLPGQESFGQADLEFPSDVSRTYPDAQPTDNRHAVFGLPAGQETSYGRTGTVIDDNPRLISHLIVNQSTDNPAAVIAHENENEDGEPIPGDLGGAEQLFIPNTAVDEGLSAPTNAFMTFFGQFFDHGLTLVNKGGNGAVVTGLQADDPLFGKTPGNVMLLTRATLDAGPDGLIGTGDGEVNPINATTPHVDQNQTYASHVSAQILLREFELRDGDDVLAGGPSSAAFGKLEDTGRLLDGYGDDLILDSIDDGGLATWGTVKAQARLKLGIELDDQDGADMPYILGDFYGNFQPGPARGLPVIVLKGAAGDAALAQFLEDGTLAETGLQEGNLVSPIDASAARRIQHSFFLDVAHSANPNGRSGALTADADTEINELTNALPDSLGTDDRVVRGIRAEAGEGEYDNELLDRHFACGDGRCNENIVLTSVHTIFHREHNRLGNITKRVALDSQDLEFLNEWLDTKIDELPSWLGLTFPISDGSLEAQIETAVAIDDLGLDWNGQRIFQAAKFGTEMQYNRIVFDEFSPTLAGLKDVFEGFHTELDPTIRGEFAHTVYRFGHSMLTETVDRFDVDFEPINGEEQLGLFEAFLNPLALYEYDDETQLSDMTPEEGVGAVLRGAIRQVSNEIDEFVTGALQNNVYGLPLDLGAINIQRGRDTGIPKLNQARREFFAETQDYRLQPYISWVDYLDNLRHEESLVNFIAAYGTHPFLAGQDGLIGSGDDPDPSFKGRRARACAIVGSLAADGVDYCTSAGFVLAPGDADAAAAEAAEAVVVAARATLDLAQEAAGVAAEIALVTATAAAEAAQASQTAAAVAQTAASAGNTQSAALNELVQIAGNAASIAQDLADAADTAQQEADDANAAVAIAFTALNDATRAAAEFLPLALEAPVDAQDFLRSSGAWAARNGIQITGLQDVDFWNGGLAEERMPFGGYLGSTHNYVFEIQLERLQNGDRFYYVGRTATIHFFGELESNSFTALAMRNSDLGEEGAGVLPINIFSAPTHVLEILEDEQFGEDPEDESELVQLVIRDPARATTDIDVPDEERFIQYTGGDHVAIGGSPERDTIVGGIGDDSLWGRAGDDRIEGGDGADSIEGGPGNDIITDLSGPDVIEGGAGCDAIASGNEEDVIFGDEGDDFIVNPSEFGEIFAGLGDDKIYDGEHLGHIRGGAGDDWMENQGGGEDLFQGDNGAAAEAGEPAIKGNDVAVSHDGNNDWDMENGDDIVVDGPGIDRVEGQLGFDWVSFQNDRYGVDVDLDLTIFNRPILPPSNASILNRYDRVEGISGSSKSDILRGTGQGDIDLIGNELVVTVSRNGFALIEGLNDAPGGTPGLVPVSQRRVLADDPITGEAQFGWTGGEIIIGGGASDLLVGEDGDDIIDGDSALDVGLKVVGDNTIHPSMRDLFAPVFDGTVSPCDIAISRVISDKDADDLDTDSALYTGLAEDYAVTIVEGGNFIRVEDLRGLPIGGDGSDLVRNVERLVFADTTEVLMPGTAGAGNALNAVATGQPEIGGSPVVGQVLTALIGSVMDASNLNGVVDAEDIAWSWESELEPGESGFSPIMRIEGGDPFAIRGQSMTVTFGEAGLPLRLVGLFQDDLGVFEIVKSDPVLIPLPAGAPPNPDQPASFVGGCSDFADATTIVENASKAGLPRLDFTTGPLSLMLFRGTEFIFPDGFGPEAEQLVSNVTLTFVNNATSMVTGRFQPEIVAIQDLVTLEVDPNNVEVLFSLRGDDVTPLVNGATTASINIDGLVGCNPVVIELTGNSSVDDAEGVLIVSVNGAPPIDPELEIAATFNDGCNELGVPGFENASRAGLPRFDFTVVGLPLASFAGANPPFTTDVPFGAEAEIAIDNILLTFTNSEGGTSSFFPEIVASSDDLTGLVTTQTEVDLLWSIRGGDVTPLVRGETQAVVSVNGVDCDVLTLDGDSSLDDAEGVELTLINGAEAPVVDPELEIAANFLGDCDNLGAPPFENASRAGLPRFDFTIADLDIRLFVGTNPPFTTDVPFGAEAEIAIDNILITFTNSEGGTASFFPEIVAISDVLTGAVTTQTEVNLLWSIRGDDVTGLVRGDTTVVVSVDGVDCDDVLTLNGDSSLDDAQGVTLTLVNGAEAPAPVEGPTVPFEGDCGDVDTDTITFENLSRVGLARLDVTIPSVDLDLFGPLDPAFSAGETPGCGPLPEICPGDEIAITGVTLTFVNDASGLVTGVFDPEIVAIEILDGDAVGTGVAEQDTVNILFSIRGADVAPLVDGPTTADLTINGDECGVYELDGDSSVNDALNVVVLTLNGAPAPVAPVVEGPVATFNGNCEHFGLATATNNSGPTEARLGFLISDVSLALFSNTETVFPSGTNALGAFFGADAVQAVSNISVSFATAPAETITGVASGDPGVFLGGPFGFELVASQNPATLVIDPNNANLQAEIRGDDAASLVNGPTIATISIGGTPCIEIVLNGDSANAPADVEVVTVDGAPPAVAPADVLPTATFVGSDPANTVTDLAILTIPVLNDDGDELVQGLVVENNSNAAVAPDVGFARLDIGILNVPLSFLRDFNPPFVSDRLDGTEELPIGNITAVFVNNDSDLPTGIFFPEMAAIVDDVDGDVTQDAVDILWSIRGGDVAPLVDGPTTITFLVNDELFATAVLDGDSAVNDAADVTVEAINGVAPLAPPSRFGPSVPGAPSIPSIVFVRGECNGDGSLDLSDIVCSLGWQFHGSFSPGCIAGLNANGDTQVNVADPIYLINYLFRAGPPPGQPYPACGTGSSALDLEFGCATPPSGCTP